jgi:hypothetical protein
MKNAFNISLTNAQISALALALIGGTTKPIDIEEIAIKIFEIAPEKFCWRNHPDRIDLRVVQYALKDASSEKKGEVLIKGNLRHGFMLTPKGVTWSESLLEVSGEIKINSARSQSGEEKKLLEILRLKNTVAYEKFLSGKKNSITKQDFQEFSRVNDYFPDHVKENRYLLIENSIREDETLRGLWEFLKHQFIEQGGYKNE